LTSTCGGCRRLAQSRRHDRTGRPHRAALREAVDAHRGSLAEGYDYDWIEQPREQNRRHVIRARIHLAELLAGTESRTAAELTRPPPAWIRSTRTSSGKPSGPSLGSVAPRASGEQLRLLRAELDNVDEEPSGETIALAAQMQREIIGGGRPDRDPPS
jgi:hypothetical protein